MNSLILLLSCVSEWSPERWALQQGGVRSLGGQVVIESSSGWISVLREDCLLDEYDDDQRIALKVLLAEPMPFLIEWKGEELLKALLEAVPRSSGAVVDNDHGVIVPIQEIEELEIDYWVRANKLP